MINEADFFRTMTLKICGHPKIEDGLRACIEFLTRHLPGDRLYFLKHEKELRSMRIVARATPEEGERVELLVPLSDEGVAALARTQHAWVTGALPTVVVFNELNDAPVSRTVLEAVGDSHSAVMVLPLVVEEQVAGLLALFAKGTERFSTMHAELFATVKEPFFVAMSNALRLDEVVRLKDRLTDDNRYLNRELQRISGDEIIGADFGLKSVMQLVRKVAPTESPVLLTGETGAGKDVVANAIHQASSRRDGPFIAVNCGAIPESLLDSELFGHEKGAFTGALSRKRGRFERAHGGTIFLDEIGEMSLDAQVRLLRVLQHRVFERIGGTKPLKVDIRVVAATNKDLRTRIARGDFREDLWFRLNVFPIEIPPLREHACDIPALVRHFIMRKTRELKLGVMPKLADGAMEQLLAYDWPGNVRELENVVERAMIIHQGEPLSFDLGAGAAVASERQGELLRLDQVIVRQIQLALIQTGGTIHGPHGAAALLGINPSTLRNRMKKLGISRTAA